MTSELRPNYPCNPPSLEPMIDQLLALRNDVVHREAAHDRLACVHPDNLRSARNLVQYLAFRTYDVRELQLDLTEWGLSSLGRAERKVQATLDTVLQTMHILAGKHWKPKEQPPVCYRDARKQLEDNADRLLGGPPQGRRVRIMVTMPSEVGSDFTLVKNLLLNGMNCARINCAHDDVWVWKRMVENIRKAADATGRTCKILMDLGGPKLRTGEVQPGPKVVKIGPKRSEAGELEAPALIWLQKDGSAVPVDKSSLPKITLEEDWLSQCQKGDRICLVDARGASRKLTVCEATELGCLAISQQTIYFVPGLKLTLKRKRIKLERLNTIVNEDMPCKEGAIRLHEGDLIMLSGKPIFGSNAQHDTEGKLTQPARISISIPSVLADIRAGEPVWFDDGKIGATIEDVRDGEALVRITLTRAGGDRLRAEKGINLPDTDLHLPALSSQDLEDLKFVVQHADMVGLSFANHPEDVERLVQYMKELKEGETIPAVVLKIETKTGFDNLPALILASMQSASCGVMIARGDLAIECGFGRLAEVQEQILWVCEAAHVPVIWATQVLDGMAKSGLPTRSEVTDAAMGQRAECIMLNKGEHIVMATKSLDEILLRMQDHQTKKRSLLRRLGIAQRFFLGPDKDAQNE